MISPTLPGGIPGLLRRGSPVVFREDRRGTTVEITAGSGMPRAEVAYLSRGLPAVVAWMPDEVALDLTDATGRAHAAWWLAAQRGETQPTEAAWRFEPAREPVESRAADGNYVGSVEHQPAFWMCGASGWDASDAVLADLDPEDPRLLPDGSRWVDAEALRRVVLHVAGMVP